MYALRVNIHVHVPIYIYTCVYKGVRRGERKWTGGFDMYVFM